MPKTKKASRDQSKKLFSDFEEEIEQLGQRISEKTKKRYDDSLGFIGPVVKTVIGIIFLAFAVWILDTMNVYLSSMFVYSLSAFFYNYMSLFFAASLMFNYAEYFSKKYSKYCLIAPIVNGLRAVFVLWIITNIFIFIGGFSNVSLFSRISMLVYTNLYGIFILAVFIGYVTEVFCCMKKCCGCKK